MTKILFFINPIAGSGKAADILPGLINSYNGDDELSYVFTEKDKSIASLLKHLDISDIDTLVAVGGDGTVSEIASFCYQNDKCLGIIPMGSGNGLARHLNIPLSIDEAFNLISKASISNIDIGVWNKKIFFNVAGIGYDGWVAYLFDKAPTRGFWTYLKAIMNSLNQFKKDHYSINIDGKEIEREAYLVSLANSGQYGNNTWIAPLAQIDDGLLDVVVVKSINWWNVWRLAYLIKSKNLDKAKSVEIYKGKKIIINKFEKRYAHIDGEPIMADEQIDVSIIPKALCVLKL